MAAEFPKLIILTGPEEGQEFSLKDKTDIRIGRFEDNDFALSDTSVSRHHCTLTLKDGTWMIRDESSRNGTNINETSLQNTSEHSLSNLDVIKMGVYEIRYLDQDFSEKDIQEGISKQATQPEEKKEEAKTEDKEEAAPVVPEDDDKEEESESDSVSGENENTDKEEVESSEPEYTDQTNVDKLKLGKGLFVFIIIAALFCILGVGLYIGFEHNKEQKENVTEDVTEEVIEEETEIEEEDISKSIVETDPGLVEKDTEETVKEEKTEDEVVAEAESTVEKEQEFTPLALDKETDTQAPSEFRVFLDVKTKPLPATIYFNDERLGLTPLKENITVKPGQEYELFADYELREINDIFRKKIKFSVKPDTDVVELDVDADIGVLKIQKLPRRVEFYLEGYYAHDKLKANPVKINDITYGKPIYLPFGKYVVELKEKTQVAGSTNYVTNVRFQREYDIKEDTRVLDLTVNDRDLQFFPARITSIPSNAEVYFGKEKMGVTPFDGKFPIGKNKIKIKKDGFFSQNIDIEMNKNAIYVRNVVLKTSKIGELINEAKEQLRHGRLDEGIGTLVTALKYGGSSREKAEVYYLLGDTYLKQKKYEQAKPYFEKSRSHKNFKQSATLGLVKTYHGLKQTTLALKQIVEVLVNIDEKTRSSFRNEANAVFKLISPVKSVIYLYSDPPGATVFVNDKPISQATPLILSDLSLGNYRLQFEKGGYEVFKTKQNVRIGEFVTVKVKLKAKPN